MAQRKDPLKHGVGVGKDTAEMELRCGKLDKPVRPIDGNDCEHYRHASTGTS
ncbi:MAG: hypothetical protein ACYS9T_00725 [Planctomycetota bacterium]